MGKVALDILLAITRTDNEFIKAIVEISFHDMPKDGLLTYLNHGLGPVLGLLADTSTNTTGKDDYFH